MIISYIKLFDCDQILFVLLIIQMSFNQQLYREYIEKKSGRVEGGGVFTFTQKRKRILNKMLKLPDELTVNLQSSINTLRELGILQKIENADHIVTIMQNKRKQNFKWQGQELLFTECRLIYFLWAVLKEQVIEMRQFKQIILLLINNVGKDISQRMKQSYGDREGIEQLLESFDSLINRKQQDGGTKFMESEDISNISIIKSKNDHLLDNQESYQQNQAYNQERSDRHKKSSSSTYDNNKENIQTLRISNAYQKYPNNTLNSKLNRTASSGKINHKPKSNKNLSNSSTKLKPFAFFSVNDNLSAAQEKKLVQRLYRVEIYKERQEEKKKIEQQRIKIQLNQCTFKPKIMHKTKTTFKIESQEIKGYNKAVERMKTGYTKNKELKQNLQYRIFKQPQNSTKTNTKSCAPKFIQRTKEPEVELFQIIFTIGRHNIRVKIRESDKISQIVEKLGKIYSLKQQYKESIRSTLQQQINKFYEEGQKPQQSYHD